MLGPVEKLLRAVLFTPTCKNCSGTLPQSNAFCEKCGINNSLFSKDVFEEEMGRPFEFYLKEICSKNHKSEEDFYEEHPELFENIFYCRLCGEKFFFIKESSS